MRQIGRVIRASAGLLVLLAGSAGAQGAKPLAKCAPDAVLSGTVCIDRFEASVFRLVDPAGVNKSLVKKIQQGKVRSVDLEGIEQLGSGDDYGDCTDAGAACDDVFAVSLAGLTPSANVTWFQAQQACRNSRKRLATSAEWQAAVAGTPDAGADNSSTACNSLSTQTVVPSGSRESCVSLDGAFDLVGNLREWVADWVPRSTTCGDWPNAISTDDEQCLAGASSDPADEPGALLRGGDFNDGTAAGPFAIDGRSEPSSASPEIGFRCVR